MHTLPVVTTKIGSEGMYLQEYKKNSILDDFYEYKSDDNSILPDFGGHVSRDWDDFIEGTLKMVESPKYWKESLEIGLNTLDQRMNAQTVGDRLLRKIPLNSHERPKSTIENMEKAVQKVTLFEKALKNKQFPLI